MRAQLKSVYIPLQARAPYTPEGARLAQYTEAGYIVQLCVLCDDVYEGLEWVRNNIQPEGIAIFGKELRVEL